MSNLPGLNGLDLSGMQEWSAARNLASARGDGALEARMTKLDPKTRQKIESTASEFESVFLSQMMEYSFDGISSDPLGGENNGGGGFASDTYRSMMLQEYGKSMTRAGGIGIADHVKETMLQTQEVDHGIRK